MIEFVLMAGNLLIGFMLVILGAVCALDTVKREAPEHYAGWLAIHYKRRGRQ